MPPKAQESTEKPTRSFSGCLQCKYALDMTAANARIAKRKCGEEHPICARCSKNGTTCKYDFAHKHRQSRQTVFALKTEKGGSTAALAAETSRVKESVQLVWQPSRRTYRTKKSKGIPDPSQEEFAESFDTSASESMVTAMTRDESSSSQETTILCQPSLDAWTLDLAILHSLLHFTETSPGTGHGFYELFPSATNHFFQLSMGNDGLRHTLLALVGVVKDIFSKSGPSEFYLTHKAMSLHYLQNQISTNMIDEILMLSVVLQIGTDFTTGNYPAIRRHCHGLYLIWQQLKQQAQRGDRGSSTLTALARVIIRMGVRADFVTAPFFDTFPEWPVFTWRDEEEDRKCFSEYSGITTQMTSDAIEWALASFEIDNLHHRVYRFAKRSNIYRTSGDPLAEHKIQSEYNRLVRHLEAWSQRSIVIQQEELERLHQLTTNPDSDPRVRFLSYDPQAIQNPYYMKLLQQWRAIWIRASAVVYPYTGPEPHSHHRYQIAVDICRTHAALKLETVLSVAWESLYYAGLAFGGQRFYPEECDWIMERSRAMTRIFSFLAPSAEAMPANWEQDHVDWNGHGELLKRLERP